MINESELLEIIAFDLETSSEYKDLHTLEIHNKHRAALWTTKVEKMRTKSSDKTWDNDHVAYETQTALIPEFGRIVCATFCQIVLDTSTGEFVGRMKSFYDNEANETSEKRLILEPVADMLEKVSKTARNYKLAGHNIKKFDIPFLAKRMVMSGIMPPPLLQTWGKKPWEITSVDTGELWAMGAWDQYVSLDLLTSALDLPSPKEFMKGEYVGENFHKNKEYEKIKDYCEEDVKAVIRILHKLSFSSKNITF